MSDPTMTAEQLGSAIAAAILRIGEIDERTKRIEHLVTPQVLTIQDVCARYLSRSERWAREHPWALPNNSESDIPGHQRVWTVATCEAWYEVPMHVHEAEWFRMHRSKKHTA